MSAAGPLLALTLGVSDVERSLRLYRDTLGLRVESDGPASPERLRLWGLPAARVVELSCEGYPVGRLRLLQAAPPATAAVRLDGPGGPDSSADIGPKAVDFYPPGGRTVADAVAELQAAGYPPRSRPVPHSEGGIESNELLFTGPDGEPFLVMEGSHGDMRRGGHSAYSEVATVSVIGGDVDESIALYGSAFGLRLDLDAVVPDADRDAVCELVGVPPGTGIRFLVFREPGEPSGKYLLVHFSGAPARRLAGRMRPGALGLALFTHEVSGLDALAAAPGLRVESGPLVVDGRRTLLARGPSEELFELVERR